MSAISVVCRCEQCTRARNVLAMKAAIAATYEYNTPEVIRQQFRAAGIEDHLPDLQPSLYLELTA